MNLLRSSIRVVRQLINIITRTPSNIFRSVKISPTSIVKKRTVINYSNIGKYSYIGETTYIESAEIGNYSSIANMVQIGGYEHAYWYPSTSHFLSKEGKAGIKTIIGNDVWIATGAFIKQGVKIGDGAVIAAGAVVIKDVPPYAIVAGVPATIKKFRFTDEQINKIQDSQYWEYTPKVAKEILRTLL